MKILFICHANIGRSQVGQAYFSKLSKHESFSAGTGTDESLKKFKSRSNLMKDAPGAKNSPNGPRGAQFVIAYMKEHGVDISENERRQLTPRMIDEADKVVAITEKDTWPDYLVESEKVIFWDIPDAAGKDPGFARKIFDEVRRRVEGLVEQIG